MIDIRPKKGREARFQKSTYPGSMSIYTFQRDTVFLPAAKPTGHRTVRVVVVVVVVGGDYFEVMTFKAKVNFFWSRSTLLFFLHSVFPP